MGEGSRGNRGTEVSGAIGIPRSQAIVSIPDAATARAGTVRGFVDLIVELLHAKPLPNVHCRTSSAFFRIRAALRDVGIHSALVRPEAALEELTPKERRGEVWARLHSKGLKPPELQFASLAEQAQSITSAMLWKTRHPGSAFPPECRTVGELAQQTAHTAEPRGDMTSDEVLPILKRLIHEQLGVPFEKITLDANFIDDFDAG